MDKLHTVEQHRLKLLSLLRAVNYLVDDVNNVLVARVQNGVSNDDLFLLKHKVESLKVLADEVERGLFKK